MLAQRVDPAKDWERLPPQRQRRRLQDVFELFQRSFTRFACFASSRDRRRSRNVAACSFGTQTAVWSADLQQRANRRASRQSIFTRVRLLRLGLQTPWPRGREAAIVKKDCL
jgi:hypothetical protein